MSVKKTKSTAIKPSKPKQISKRMLLKFANEVHLKRPMIFFEMLKAWEWRQLATNQKGAISKKELLKNVSNLYDQFVNDPDEERSMVMIAQARVPTMKEFVRLCDKYGYECEVGGVEDDQ